MDNITFFDRFDKLLEKVKVDFDLKDKHDALISWFVENFFGVNSHQSETWWLFSWRSYLTTFGHFSRRTSDSLCN